MTSSIYVDSNILIYTVDGDTPLKTAAQAVVTGHLQHGHRLFSSELALGECLRGVRLGTAASAAAFQRMFDDTAFLTSVPVTRPILIRAASLGLELNLKLVDAIHVATAEALQCDVFLTNDRGIRAPATIEIRHL